MIETLILALVLSVFLSCEYYKFKTGVPTVVSFPSAQKKIVTLLKATLKPEAQNPPYKIVDLGSGGGQLCRRIALSMPYVEVIGVELSFLPWLRSAVFKRALGPANLHFKRLDFWGFDCSDVDVVVLFLTGNILDRLGRKLHKELKPGALVVANDEPLGDGWIPLESKDNPVLGVFYSKIYIYRQA